MIVTRNGMVMEGTPEEIAQLMKLVESNKKPVQIEAKPVVIMGDPFKVALTRAQAIMNAYQ